MNNLILNSKGAERHYGLIEAAVKDRIEKILQRKYVGKSPNRVYLEPVSRRFLSVLQRDAWLKKLITMAPADMEVFIQYITANFPQLLDPAHAAFKIVTNLFVVHGYEKGLDKFDFVSNVSIDTCIYCNRNYTYILDRASLVKPEIDHFFPTSIYPFLGLSFYNLIPSCQTCNGFSCKRQQDPRVLGLLNPYLINNADFTFSYRIGSIKVLNPLINTKSISVVLTTKKQGHLDTFKLDRLYEKHTDHVLELIVKSKLSYTDKYRRYLKSYKRLNFSNHEIDRLIIGNYSRKEDVNKRPLAKLYQDIARELGLIK